MVLFTKSWAEEYTATKFCQNELNLDTEAITDWKSYLRVVCTTDLLLKNPIAIGGPNLTTKIRELCLTKRGKNVGLVFPQPWVFNGYCHETKEYFIFYVRSKYRYFASGNSAMYSSWNNVNLRNLESI